MNQFILVGFSSLLPLCIAFLLNISTRLNNFAKSQTVLVDSVLSTVLSKGPLAGDYHAFPDAIRLKNGDIMAVFYGGDSHVTPKNEKYPKSGRICMVRSTDDGDTWSEPVIIYDDPEDNRDPHINQLKDGTLVVSFFNRYVNPVRGESRLIRSRDSGKTWDTESQEVVKGWYCSARVHQLSKRVWILPVYTSHGKNSYRAGSVRSEDGGKTWNAPSLIQTGTSFTTSEIEFVSLRNGSLLAGIRGNAKENINLHWSVSADKGKTWSPMADGGFLGDAPSFTRLKSGEILLSYRAYSANREWKSAFTALRISRDEGKTWQGPYVVDKHYGAYPSTIERRDGSILMVYYEEGVGSTIRAKRFKKPVSAEGQTFERPLPVEGLSLK